LFAAYFLKLIFFGRVFRLLNTTSQLKKMNQTTENQKVNIKQKFFSFNTLAAFLAAVIIIYIFITRFDFTESIAIIGNSDFKYIIIGIIFFYGFIPLRGYRWRAFLKESNIYLPTFELTRLYFLSFFVNSILPARIGDIYRAYLLKKNRSVSFLQSLGVLFSERVFDLASTALLVLLGGVFYLDMVASPEIRNYIITGLVVISGVVLLFIIFSWRSKWLIRFLPEKFRDHYEAFTKGLLKSPSSIPNLLGQSMAVWLSEAARFYFVAWALDCRIDIMMAIFISQTALVLMSLPITPAGLGIVELFMFAALTPAGFTKEQTAAIIIADRLISYWSVIILGGLHYIFSARYR